MLHKTRGIALHTIKYGDTSIIAHVYTEGFGRQAYIVKGAYNKKSSIKAALFYPLNLLEMDVYYKPGSNLQKIKEAQNSPIYKHIPFNSQKNAIVVFLSEIIYRTLREEEANPRLFNFILNALQILDLGTKKVADFHLIFLLQLSKFTGFYPLDNYSTTEPIFDLLNGRFVSDAPIHGHFIHFDESKIFSSLINKSFDDLGTIKLSRELRQYLLEKLVEYYRLHIENMGNVKSLQVLKEVFD
jgi:DNA repair protein RecO (recombination protein O)